MAGRFRDRYVVGADLDGAADDQITGRYSEVSDRIRIAYRGTIIVDDEGTVRSFTVSDLGAGRSPQEVLRTVQALQSGGLCGADWKKGDDFVA